MGEPMEWCESDSLANRLSMLVASNDFGYMFKQFVADIIAGEYDREETERSIQDFIRSHPVALYSFTTCPFCRRAKVCNAIHSDTYNPTLTIHVITQ